MKNEKTYMGFCIPNVWQILKHFMGAFRWAQTSYFWRVYYVRKQTDFIWKYWPCLATCSIVLDITSGQASWVRIWNMEKNASIKVSNLVKSFKEQNNCIDILEVMTKSQIVNMINVPNFLPGPKILYTNSSNIGEACINLATLIT